MRTSFRPRQGFCIAFGGLGFLQGFRVAGYLGFSFRSKGTFKESVFRSGICWIPLSLPSERACWGML